MQFLSICVQSIHCYSSVRWCGQRFFFQGQSHVNLSHSLFFYEFGLLLSHRDILWTRLISAGKIVKVNRFWLNVIVHVSSFLNYTGCLEFTFNTQNGWTFTLYFFGAMHLLLNMTIVFLPSFTKTLNIKIIEVLVQKSNTKDEWFIPNKWKV